MKSSVRIISFLFLIFAFSLEAREEVILTVPKSGTHYLKKIIECITGNYVMQPVTPKWYSTNYNKNKDENWVIVMGHCEPKILSVLPKSEKKMLLIRDPRDVVLSAIDYIDQMGLDVWPGLSDATERLNWTSLTKKQKAAMILNQFYHPRELSIVSIFETAIDLVSQENCLVIKFENLSPENRDYSTPRENIASIARFLGKELNSDEIESVLEKSFKNKESFTLNKGNAYRYVTECDESFRNYLNIRLIKYIKFFDYDL